MLITLPDKSKSSCSPEKDSEENTIFNKRVSQIRIRSEHAIGFLKGRFQSLRGLRCSIRSQIDMQFTNAWIVACITAHNFAMRYEDEAGFQKDEFFQWGVETAKAEQEARQGWLRDNGEFGAAAGARQDELNAGRARRERLKAALFEN